MAVASVSTSGATAGGPRLGCAARVRRTHRGDGCLGAPHFSQWVFTSLDGGRTFTGRKIDDVTPVSDTGLVTVGPGQGNPTIEFPTVAQRGSTLYAVWNDGGRGSADLGIATSTNGGSAWSKTWLTGGGDDDLMPAIAADLSGVHVALTG